MQSSTSTTQVPLLRLNAWALRIRSHRRLFPPESNASVFSLLLEIDQVRDRVDIAAFRRPTLSLFFIENGSREIVPAKFGHKAVPDHEIAFVEAPAIRVAPIENLFVRSTFQHALGQNAVVHPEKIRAGGVRRSRLAQMIVVIFP